jgi:hypothetical protein
MIPAEDTMGRLENHLEGSSKFPMKSLQGELLHSSFARQIE